MENTNPTVLPDTMSTLARLGDRLSLARKRRDLTAEQMAKRAGVSVPTLRSLERGGTGVGIGAYLSVLEVLGLEKDFDSIASVDELGRQLQDMRLKRSKR